MDDWRCFLAVRIPPLPRLRSLLAELAAFGRPLRSVHEDDLHVTLKFLGPVPAERLPDITRAVEHELSPPAVSRIDLRGLGAFPRPQRPAVVWAESCERACEPLGFARERRAFRPHVTLARITGRAPQGLLPWLETQGADHVGQTTIEAVELLRSESGPGGARYQTLWRYPLRVSS